MPRNTICLSMIVRDEAHVISRCLRSVRRHIDHWVISDTGSKDDTIKTVVRELEGIPGRVRRDSWVDFSTNRNLALDEAREAGCDYIMVIDADEELITPDDLEFADLDADSYAPMFHLRNDDAQWRRQMLLRSDVPWRYAGVIHERPVCPDTINLPLPNVHVMSHHDSARNKDPIAKYKRDVKTLKKAIKNDPRDPRNWFYLGMCLAGAQKIDAAIDAYRKRVEIGGDADTEEVFYSLYQIAALKDFRGDHWRDVAYAYLRAYNERPTRAEPLWAAAGLHGRNREFAVAELYCRRAASMPIPQDALLVHGSVYAWRAAMDLAGYLAEQGNLAEAKKILKRLVSLPQLPEEERPTVEQNIRLLEAA